MRKTRMLILRCLLPWTIVVPFCICSYAQCFGTDNPTTNFAVAHGNVQVEDESGNRKPAENALADIYRLDRGGHWSVRTDSRGNYSVTLPYIGVYLIEVSGPGLMPIWVNKLQLKQTRTIDFITYPGDGNTLSRSQIRELNGRGRTHQEMTFYDQKFHYKVRPTPSQKAAYFQSLRENAAAIKSVHDLKVESDQALERYNQALWLKIGGEYSRSLEEFAPLLPYYGSSDEYFAKIARATIVNMAEAHYLWAIDLFDKGYTDQAKDHFSKAIDFGNRYIGWATTSGKNLDDDSRSLILPTYRIIARSGLDLVKLTQLAEFKNAAIRAAEKAAAIDPNHKSDWGLLKARAFRASGDREGAVAEYRAVLGSDPENGDALYELSLLLVKSQSAADFKEAADCLRRFVRLARPDDERLPAAKQALQALESTQSPS